MKRGTIVPMLLAVALAGCDTTDVSMAPAETGKTVNVERVRVQLAAAYAPGTTDLPLTEARRLQTFLDQSGMRPNDHAYVAVPAGDPLAAARVGRLAETLSRRGIGIERVPPPEGVEANHLLLMVDRYVVTPPACPDWSGSPQTPHTNTPSSNFGCATMTNFALMVDSPRDLLTGRALGPATGDQPLGAVQRYRTDQVKPLLSVGQSGGQAGAPGAGQSQAAPGGGSGGGSPGGAPGGN